MKSAKLRTTTPVLLVGDIAATLQWYQTKLGFSGRAVPKAPPHAFGILEKDDISLFLQQLEGYRKPDLYDQRAGGVWNVYVRTDNVRALYEGLLKFGNAEIIEPLCRKEYG